MSFKDNWFAHYERLLNEGVDESAAPEIAYQRARDDLADRADAERKRRKESQ